MKKKSSSKIKFQIDRSADSRRQKNIIVMAKIRIFFFGGFRHTFHVLLPLDMVDLSIQRKILIL